MVKILSLVVLLIPLHVRGDFPFFSALKKKVLDTLDINNRRELDKRLTPVVSTSSTFCIPKIVADGPVPTERTDLAEILTLTDGFDLKNNAEKVHCRDTLTAWYTNWHRDNVTNQLTSNMVFPPAAVLQHCESGPSQTLAKIVRIADSFNRKTRAGRTQCRKAISNWYKQNSIWSHLNQDQRFVQTVDLMNQSANALRDDGVSLHRDLNLGVLSCIGKIEAASYYPETVNMNDICNVLCNKIWGTDSVSFSQDPEVCRMSSRSSWPGKNLSIGLGQVTARTFHGNERHEGFAEQVGFTGNFSDFSVNPESQLEMKVLHLNNNIRMFARRPEGLDIYIGVGEEESKCVTEELSLTQKAIAYYDQWLCKIYVRKFQTCMDICFPDDSAPTLGGDGLSGNQTTCLRGLSL